MKDLWYLIFENSENVEFEIQDIQEIQDIKDASKTNETDAGDISNLPQKINLNGKAPITRKKFKYKIKGVFSTANKRNKNGRLYPKDIMEYAVNDYIENHLKKGTINTLSEWQHPPRTNVDPMEAVGKITKLYWDGDFLMGEAILLDNAKANQLKSLIDAGIKLGVSTRGLGKLDESKTVTNYKLITIDIVDNPSNYESYVSGLSESYIHDGIYMKEAYVEQDGKFVSICLDDKCSLVNESELKELKQKTLDKFKDALKNVSL